MVQKIVGSKMAEAKREFRGRTYWAACIYTEGPLGRAALHYLVRDGEQMYLSWTAVEASAWLTRRGMHDDPAADIVCESYNLLHQNAEELKDEEEESDGQAIGG